MARILDVPAVKAKGLLKGLRYISQIFDGEKEQEMVIGIPTDIKHVAHIGWDGPATINNNPSWVSQEFQSACQYGMDFLIMNEFHSAPLSTTLGPDAKEVVSPKSAFQEIPIGGIPPPSPARDEEAGSAKPRRTRRHASSEAPGSASPARGSRGRSRHSRKHHSTGSAPDSESPGREGESSRSGHRHHKSDIVNGYEPNNRNLPSIPKTKKERRSKGSSDGASGSSRSRSKNPPCPESGAERRAARPIEEAV